MSDRMDDEADKWFYNMGEVAKKIQVNSDRAMEAQRKAEIAQKKADTSRHRFMALSAFTLFAFLLLSYRSEVQAHRSMANSNKITANTERIEVNTERIRTTQQESCLGGLEILKKFNAEQDALIAVETSNKFVDAKIRKARITAYQNARILPLPVCQSLR